MRGIKYLLLLAITIGILTIGAQPAAAEIKPLINEVELYALLAEENTVLLDISPAEDYQLGHIPGAINIQRSGIINPQGVLPAMLLSPTQLQNLLGSIGVENGNRIVICGQVPFDTTRLWWTLRFYGVEDVCIFNGNQQTWSDLGYPLTSEIPRLEKSEYRLDPLAFQTQTNATTDQVKALIGSNSWIIDARQADEFSGRVMASGAERRGRIPGAVNFYWQDNLNATGRFKSLEELREMYLQKGISDDKPVIVYCHSGFQSSLDYFVLTQLLGYRSVANYDASWIGWSREKDLPIECDYSRFIIGSRDYEIKGIPGRMDVAPYVKSDRLYLPMRQIALVMGISEKDIRWDGTTGTVTISKGETTATITMEKQTIAVNGLEKTLDALPEILLPGRVMLPARAVAEAFSAGITWEKATNQVWIKSREI